MNSEDKKLRYAMLIQWSDEDNGYVVSLPEWGPYCSAFGASYEEAVKNAREVLELLLDPTNDAAASPAPEPNVYHGEMSMRERFVHASVEHTTANPRGRKTA